MRSGYGDGLILPLSVPRWTILDCYLRQQWFAGHECDKEHVKCVEHRIPDD
jgi:hypothetical protein